MDWLNGVLRARNEKANSLVDLKDGVLLCKILEILSGSSIGKYCKNPTLLAQKLDNVSLAFSFMQNRIKNNIRFDASSFVNGNLQTVCKILF